MHSKMEEIKEVNQDELCLICSIKVNNVTKDFSEIEENLIENEITNNLISKNLSAVFILQKLLQVPNFYLKWNLLEYGDPRNWLTLCDQCTELTGKAWRLHQQIVKINQELGLIKTTILDKARSSSCLSNQETEDNLVEHLISSPKENNKQKLISNRKQIYKATREFIENYDYSDTNNLVNSFIEGDKLAEYLASQRDFTNIDPVTSSEVNYEIEYDVLEANNFEDDYLSISPPPSPSSPSALKPVRTRSKFVGKLEYLEDKDYSINERPHRKAPGGNFYCEICGNNYHRNSHLIRHKRLIHKLACKPVLKPKVSYYICKLCGKQIKSKEGLKHHINVTHDKQFKFFCEVCGVGRPNTVTMKLHMLAKHKDDPTVKKMMEEGERIWKCGVEGCAIQFLKKTTLDKHTEKYHPAEGEKMFKCENCEISFWRRSDLKRHQIVHLKKKQNRAFKCDICGKGYGTESYLAIHKQSFH